MKKSAGVLMSVMVLFAGQVYAQEWGDIDALLGESARLRLEINQLIGTKQLVKTEKPRLADKEMVSASEKITESKETQLADEVMNSISEKATEPEEIQLDGEDLLSESVGLRQELNQLLEREKVQSADKVKNSVVETDKPKSSEKTTVPAKNSKPLTFRQRVDQLLGTGKTQADKVVIDKTTVSERESQQTSLIEVLDVSSNDNAVFTGTDCRVFDYRPGEVNDICLKPGFITDICLPVGEELKKVTLGNDMFFDVKTYANYSGDGSWHIYVNPIQKNVETNMIIATDVRNYYLQLMSGEMFFPFVKWNVNDSMVIRNGKRVNPSELLTMDVDSIKDLHFDYVSTPKKKAKWAPVSVFDDNYWNTYLVFEAGRLDSIEPLIFAEKSDGSLEIIPYKKVEDTIVIKRVCSDFMVKVSDGFVKYHRKS